MRILLFAAALWPASQVSAIELRFNAFGDISAGAELGEYADEDDREEWNNNGFDQDPVNSTRGFTMSGTDFVITADIDDNLVYQGEINLQTCRGCSDEIEVDVERMYLDYSITSLFNIQAGLYFTPIGYSNRNFYARAWLMNSIQVRDFVEEELGFVPTHTIGTMFHGDLDFGNTGLMYAISIGNGRPSEATGAIYARDTNPANEVAVLLEYRLNNFKNFRLGLSGWTDRILANMVGPEYGDGAIMDGENNKIVRLRETGINPFLIYDHGMFGLFVEYVSSSHKDENKAGEKLKDNGWEEEEYKFTALTAEFALHFADGTFHPYVRYDETKLPEENGGPYYTIREDIHKYVPNFKAAMVGFAYDLYTFNRVKLEYIQHLDGPRKNAVVVQSAFAL